MLFPNQGNVPGLTRQQLRQIGQAIQARQGQGIPYKTIIKGALKALKLSVPTKVFTKLLTYQFTNDTPDITGHKQLRGQISPNQPSAKRIDSKQHLRRSIMTDRTSRPNDDMDIGTGARTASAGTGTSLAAGANKNGQETQVSEFSTIDSGITHTRTARLPWRTDFKMLDAGNTSSNMIRVRMNSIYDIMKDTLLGTSSTLTEADWTSNLIAGTTTNTNLQQPAWRPLYDQYYKFYTVLSTNWKLTVTNVDTNQAYATRILTMYSGDVAPPIGGLEYKQIQYWTGIDNDELLWSVGNPSTNNSIFISDTWYPGTHHRDVHEDAEAKIWTAMAASPTQVEDLAIIICVAPEAELSQRQLRFTLELEYIVQFKELETIYQFPTAANNTDFAPLYNTAP